MKLPILHFAPGLIASALALLAATQTSQAQNVFWQVLENEVQSDFSLSNGSNMSLGFGMEIGWFDTAILGGAPTVGNFSLWDAAWHSLGSGVLKDYSGTVGTQFAFEETTGPFAGIDVGKQIYLWGSAGQTNPAAEQALITNAAWQFPGGPPTVSISPHDPGSVAIVGAIESHGSFESLGGGTYTRNDSHLQTATIPEPASILLLALGGLLGFRRRR